MKQIYLDHAATTKTRQEVLDAMLPCFTEQYGNPSSLHSAGLQAKKRLGEAREAIAQAMGCQTNEIYFTSGGTESDNWAIKGYVYANRVRGCHIITSQIEHHAVLHTCEFLERNGFEVTYLPVDESGSLVPEQLEKAIRPDTILISIQYANNEIGTIQPMQEIAAIAQKHGIALHTDAVQAVGHVPIHLADSGIAMLSASAHKFGGPKGMGFLYVKEGLRLEPLMHGGAQEKTKRSGTENVPGVVGMAKALTLSLAELPEEERVRKLRDALEERLLREIPYAARNGNKENRLAGNLSISFSCIEASSLLVFLDLAGIYCSSGSACTSASSKPSHVLQAIGLPEPLISATIRLTLGSDNTQEEMDIVAEAIRENVEKLRRYSPYYKG